MVGNAHTTNVLHDCPSVGRRARFEGRLPARKRVCPECGGRGRVTPIRREHSQAHEGRGAGPSPAPLPTGRCSAARDQGCRR